MQGVSLAQSPGATSDAGSAQLADASMEDLMNVKVYSASRYEQTAGEAPASVTVVTRQEIERYGFRTLADVIRSVPGFFVTSDLLYSYAGARGFANPGDYNTRILLLVDGHRLNDAIFEQAMLGTEFPVDIDMVERVEVIRGPASSIYGTNAVFGVINVITRTVANLRGLELSADAGSFNSYRGRASYGGTAHGIDMVLSATYYDSKGPNQLFFPVFNTPATNQGIASHDAADQYSDLLATLSGHGFTFQAVYGARDKGDPTGSWDTVFNDSQNREKDGHGYLDLRYQRTVAKNWAILVRSYYDRYTNDGFFVLPGSMSQTVVNRDFIRGAIWGAELQVSRTIANRHKLTGGVEYRNNFRQQLSNWDIKPSTVNLNVDIPSDVLSAYLQDEFKISSKLVFTAGLRGDRDTRIGSSVNPRLSLAYTLWDKTTLKLIFGTAFRAPNAYELYYAAPPISEAALRLKPERIRAWEGDWVQELTPRMSLSASIFQNRMSDFIEFTALPNGMLSFRNLTNADAVGGDMEFLARAPLGINLGASYSYQDATNGDTGAWLSGSPKHLAKLNVDSPLIWPKLHGALEVQYVSKRLTLADNFVSAYTVVNVTLLGQKLTRNLDLSASVYNLLNQSYFDPGAQQHKEDSLQQAGRSFRIKLVWHWGEK